MKQIIVGVFLVFVAANSMELNAETIQAGNANYDVIQFVPSIGILFEGGPFLNNDVAYSGMIRRVFAIDVIRYNNIVVSTYVDERNFFMNNRPAEDSVYRIQYYMEFFNLRWEFKNGSLSAFMDHTCNNILNENNTEPYQLGWYRYGIKWETLGNRIGYKNREINFNSVDSFIMLNNINYMIEAGKTITTDYGFYKFILNGSMRYDILRFYNMIAFTEFSLFTVFDWKAKVDVSVELGTRFHLQNIDITPFIRNSYQHNVDIYNGKTVDFWYIGLRMESLIGDSQWGSSGDYSESFPTPQIHFAASYGKYFSSNYLNYNYNAALNVDLFRIGNFLPFIGTNLTYDTPIGETPWPRYLRYCLEGGVDYFINSSKNIFEVYYDHISRDEGNFYKGYREHSNFAGLRIMSTGMRIGYINYGIDVKNNGNFKWLNKFNWELGMGYNVRNTNYNYITEFEAKIRWDVFRWGAAIPYLMQTVNIYYSSEYAKRFNPEYATEGGIRLFTGVNTSFYYRFYHHIDIDRVRGLNENIHLVGLRLEM